MPYFTLRTQGCSLPPGELCCLMSTKAEWPEFEQRYGPAVLTIRAITGGAGYAQRHANSQVVSLVLGVPSQTAEGSAAVQ
jgi:hypothetical protein